MSDYERKELEEKIFCAKCGTLVEDTLLLTCEHNLCLPCAAKNLSREESKNIHKHKTIVCDICFNTTGLDNATASELLSVFQPNFKSSSNYNSNNYANYNNTINSNYNNYNSSYPKRDKNFSSLSNANINANVNESLLNMSIASKSNNQNISTVLTSTKKEFCKEHGEELTYYCFDCLCRCICSECVVHGAHRNHEVMNVKRAYPLIVEKSDELLFNVQNRIQEIASVQNYIESKKKELVDNTNVIKQEMAKAFEEIRIRLQKKEKEILSKTEDFLQEHLQEMNTYSRVIHTKIISLNKLIDGINSHVTRKDEVNLLNFYSENKKRIMQTVETEIPEIPDFNSIYNIKVTVNQNSFDSLINSLNAIHMEVTSLKGFEINKVQTNTQKFAIKRDLYGIKNVPSSNNAINTKLNLSPSQFNYSSADMSRKDNLNVSFKSLSSNMNSNIEELSEKYRAKIN